MHPRLHQILRVQVGGFDWDEGNREKCGRHGVSTLEAEEVFSDDAVQVFPDLRHSGGEPRLLGIGRTRRGRFCFVAFTLRMLGQHAMIRPISVRYMHRREVAKYAKEEDS
jgi:hypothetical protein